MPSLALILRQLPPENTAIGDREGRLLPVNIPASEEVPPSAPPLLKLGNEPRELSNRLALLEAVPCANVPATWLTGVLLSGVVRWDDWKIVDVTVAASAVPAVVSAPSDGGENNAPNVTGALVTIVIMGA